MRAESWQLFDEVTSTNDSVLAAGEQGAPEGLVHLARTQTQGRGRLGRAWWSPPGAGLWMSVLLRPRLAGERAPGIALVAGRAARDALAPLVRSPIDLHWPNDLWIGRRKLGGILCELRQRREKFWIALGIGINIDLRPESCPGPLRERVTCLSEHGAHERVPLAIAKRIVAKFWPLYDRYQDGVPLPELVLPALARVGGRVRVALSSDELLEGSLDGIGPRGELLVRAADGTVEEVRAGDVEYLDDAGA